MKSDNTDNNSKTKDKDFGGYGHWKREDINETRHTMPTKVEDPQILLQPKKTNSQGSVWNNAKTWEEKTIKKEKLEEFFNQVITQVEFGGLFRISSVSNISGDTFFVFVNNRVKLMYDCSLKIYVKGLGEFSNSSGEVEISEIVDTDFNFDYKTFSGDRSSKLIGFVKSMQADIEAQIRETFIKYRDMEVNNCS